MAVHAGRAPCLPSGQAHPVRPVSGAYLAERPGRLWPVTSSDALTGIGGHATATQTIASAPRHFPRKRDAEQWLASHEVAIARGEWVDPTLSKITVGEWLPRWLALQVQLKPTTMVRYEVALRNQILPRWELVPLSRITHSDVSSWVHGLTDDDHVNYPTGFPRGGIVKKSKRRVDRRTQAWPTPGSAPGSVSVRRSCGARGTPIRA
jgi:Phage integrase, N-terminal SAM-like domain